jgi:hypothetical protein
MPDDKKNAEGPFKQKFNSWVADYVAPRKNYIFYVVAILDALVTFTLIGVFLPQTADHFYGTISANPAYGFGIILFLILFLVLSFLFNLIDLVMDKVKAAKIKNLSGERREKYEKYLAETERKKALQEANEKEFFQQNPDLNDKQKKF